MNQYHTLWLLLHNLLSFSSPFHIVLSDFMPFVIWSGIYVSEVNHAKLSIYFYKIYLQAITFFKFIFHPFPWIHFFLCSSKPNRFIMELCQRIYFFLIFKPITQFFKMNLIFIVNQPFHLPRRPPFFSSCKFDAGIILSCFFMSKITSVYHTSLNLNGPIVALSGFAKFRDCIFIVQEGNFLHYFSFSVLL